MCRRHFRWSAERAIAMVAVIVDLCIHKQSADNRTVCVNVFEIIAKRYILCLLRVLHITETGSRHSGTNLKSDRQNQCYAKLVLPFFADVLNTSAKKNNTYFG